MPVVPLSHLLDSAAARFPRRPALFFFGRTITYRSLLHSVDRCAAGLRRLGVHPGDRISLILPNCPQQVIALYAAMRVGAVAVLHNPLFTEEELAHELADCAPRAVVVLDKAYPKLHAVREDGLKFEHVFVTSLLDYLPSFKRLMLRLPLVKLQRRRAEISAELPDDPGLLDFSQLLDTSFRRIRQHPVNPERDLAVITYTGGTEGRPKGVMLTHRNLVTVAQQMNSFDPDGEDGREVTLAVLPIFHSFGLTDCLNAPIMRAGGIVLVPRFESGLVIKAIRRHRVTLFPGVPTMLDQIVETPGVRAADLRSMRVVLSGAIPLRRETVTELSKLTDAIVVQGYGLTEAAPCVTCSPLHRVRNETVGVPVPLTDMVVVDQEEPTRLLPPGQPGELVVRGPQVFAGYWRQPEATAEVLSKGWLRTGDIGVMDDEGYFTLLERARDMIKVSGFSVYPSEVEDVLRRHPAVYDCAVIGMPDPRRGEKVVAYVVEHPAYPFSADELRRHCEKFLAHYKVPREFRPRTELPKSLIGKVVRRILRDDYNGITSDDHSSRTGSRQGRPG